MSISSEYHSQLQKKQFQVIAEQKNIVQQLEALQLSIKEQLQQRQSFSHKLRSFFNFARPERRPELKGYYIWGDVGRGKTWLMDMFYDTLDDHSLTGRQKIRLHYNHFMQFVHDQLSLLDRQQNPLQHIARAFARRYQILCLDEFHVSDITDAMLLSGLLNFLFKEGLILVATSNQPPDDLYKNGLQRERFLPAIELIKKYTHTLLLDGKTDHRLRILEKADTWYPANIADSDAALEKRFLELTTAPARRQQKICINYRNIETQLCTRNIIWFEFQIICGDHRGSADYIQIAQQFHTVFISNIEIMNDGHNDKARRFINMIDEFYDRNVNLLCSAATRPEDLYTGKQLSFEFKRTASRLQEMRSHDYMQRPHKS
ncbi:MAG TPA: cell division protein ZapE [Gammaproteobacteria bacterium]|nr:cell division protein ZapE [Gammaproteobacteria bacterium]